MSKDAPPQVRIDGDTLAVTFDRIDAGATYDLFKRCKSLPEYRITSDADTLVQTITAPARFAHMLGVETGPVGRWDALPSHPSLLDDQRSILSMAIAAERFACWSDCGQGKTFTGLEFARQVIAKTGGDGRVLIVTLNEIVGQWIDEARKWYGDALHVARIESREDMREWCQHGTMKGIRIAAKVAVTNYEKFNHRTEAEQVVTELRHLAGIVLDESSRLKTGGGKQKWSLIKSARGIRFKLSLTATPAPNEIMEFCSQASFLEKLRDQNEIIWTYFRRDEKTHRWTVKHHARSAFFDFMAGWSIYVKDPRRYGWRMNVEPPPEPTYLRHTIPITPEQRQMVMDLYADPRNVPEKSVGMMFAGELNAIAANRLSQAAKGFIYEGKSNADSRQLRPDQITEQRLLPDVQGSQAGGTDNVPDVLPQAAGQAETRPLQPRRRGVRGGGVGVDGVVEGRGVLPAQRHTGRTYRRIDSNKPTFVADLIRGDAGKRKLQTLVWTVYDAESQILADLLQGARFKVEVLTGATSRTDRLAILDRFRRGETRVLISRANMLGYGMNFQFCGSMVFSGFTFSYEGFYQAVRRAYRHGQERSLRVHLPIIPELEGQMWDAIERKSKQHDAAVADMERNYVDAVAKAASRRERAA